MKSPIRLLGFAAVVALGVAFASAQGSGTRTVITFAEDVKYTSITGPPNSGFGGQDNAYLISGDGAYRLESFWHQTDGHFHTSDPQFAVFSETWMDVEENHNNAGSFGFSTVQGARITRVDGGPFSLVGMDLHGGVAVGSFKLSAPVRPEDPEEGSWRLYTGDLTFTGNPKVDLRMMQTITFGSRHNRVYEIFLADPAAAGAGVSTGGSAGSAVSHLFAHNAWDNIVLEAATP